jgi:hypothetical protein
MDKKKIFIAIGVTAGAVVLFLIGKKMFFPKQDSPANFETKSVAASYIVTTGNHTNVDAVMGFDDDYVTSWAKAIKAGQKTFEYNGTTYNIKGGKSVKK